jgi:hypothetical protein
MYVPAGRKSVVKHGSVGKTEYQCQWNISDDGKGLLNGSLRIFINHRSGTPIGDDFSTPQRGEKHPFDERLYCIGSNVQFGNNDIAYCDANYVGLKEDPCHITWQLNCPTEDTDIQLHEKFLIKDDKEGFGIVKEEPTDDKPAVFDTKKVEVDPKTGQFERFRYTKENGPTGEKMFYGVRSFKDPRITMNVSFKTAKMENWAWTLQFIRHSMNFVPMIGSWTQMGKTKDDKRNWLLMDSNVTEETGFYNVSFQMALSGKAGWNKNIYPTFKPTV